MNEPLVDILARRANDNTRRGALRLLAGGGVAGLAGWLGMSDADAKKKCGRGKKKCGKRCIRKRACCDCVPGQHCLNGRCGLKDPGELRVASDLHWSPCTSALGSRPFEPYVVNWPGGAFLATMTGSEYRAWLWIYKAADFDPGSPCSGQSWNAQATAPGETASYGFPSSAPLPRGKYVIVATGARGTGELVPEGSFRLQYGPQ